MKNIALITNFNIHEKANAALTVAEALVGFGATVLIASQNKDRIFRLHRNRREYVYLPLEELYREADADTKKKVLQLLKGEEDSGDNLLEGILETVQALLENK